MGESTALKNGETLYTCIVKEIGTNKRNLENKESAGGKHDDANVVHTTINVDGDFCDVLCRHVALVG